MGEKTLLLFKGNCPRNVTKDAHYSIKHDKGNYVVGIFYRTDDGEIWYPISDNHSELVDMVIEVKTHITGSAGGRFYINEYRQVIVPCVGDDGNYYYAGEYHEDLVFEFEGKTISGNAVGLDGRPIHPRDNWLGPHPGIPYILAAGGKDIYYRYSPRPRVKIEVRLSQVIGREKAAKVAKTIAEVKGGLGGRFYVNEFCQIFAPRTGDYGVDYIYVGKLGGLENWFPKPDMGSVGAEAAASSDTVHVPTPAIPQFAAQSGDGLKANTIKVDEGAKGHSYESLFGPYLKDATMIRVYDPYIREEHQIRNFRDFCAMVKAEGNTVVRIRLHTMADSSEEKKNISDKLDNIKRALEGTNKSLAYYFKGTDHDRWIATDTGWKILLTRGLDIFNRPETSCGLEEVDQSLKSCRGFHVTYERTPIRG